MVNQNEIPNPLRALLEGKSEWFIYHTVNKFNQLGLEAALLWINTLNDDPEIDWNVSKRVIMERDVGNSLIDDELKAYVIELIRSTEGQTIPDDVLERLSEFDDDELREMHFVAFKAVMAVYHYGNGGEFDPQTPADEIRDERHRRGLI
jgi:hypothetical protein